jgi:nucleotide-binding universal stress UspA family protein
VPAIHRILVPTDFSPSARAALEYAAFLASRFGASLDVLHVSEPPGYVGPDTLAFLPHAGERPRGPAPDEVKQAVEGILARLADRPGQVEVRVESGEPGDAILRAAREGGADLVVMGTHGRTGLSRLLLGSVAEAVLRRASCPVLTIRVPSKEPRELASP